MPLRVLMVHAASDDREMYAEFLRADGLDVLEAGTTDEALAKVAEGDVVVTGLMVPGSLPPLELIDRLRHGSRAAGHLIVVLTACASPEALDAARRAGADVVLVKPCYPDTLLDELRRLLENRGVRHVADGVYLVPVSDRRHRPRHPSP